MPTTGEELPALIGDEWEAILGDNWEAIADLKKTIDLYRQQGNTEWLQRAAKRLEKIQK
jgi:hypothetical protein